jgi:hypothetical protein
VSGEKLPWVPWYHRDFIMSKTVQAKLDDSQRWWYMRLLAFQWDHHAVPLDPDDARNVVAPHPHSTRKQWEHFAALLPKMFPALEVEGGKDELLGANRRLEEIRAKHVGAVEARIERARKAGLASGRARQSTNTELN